MSDIYQKDRTKPTAITDIAINKVPCTQFQGFTHKENEVIQQRHKDLLKNARKLCNLHGSLLMKVVYLINLHDLSEYWVVEGITDSMVSIKSDMSANQKMQTGYKNSLLLMHNHPSSSTFSAEDFKLFCNTKSLYIMTVVGNNGTVYTLTKDKDFNPVEAL